MSRTNEDGTMHEDEHEEEDAECGYSNYGRKTRTRPPVCRFDSGEGHTDREDDGRKTKREQIGVRCDQDSTRTQSKIVKNEEGTTVLPGT